MFPEEL